MKYGEYELLVLKSVGKIITQHNIAHEIGCSIGKVNYVLNALMEKGLIKAEKFVISKQKYKYTYLLTAEGLKEKIALTEYFVDKKKKEYDVLLADLEKYKANGEYTQAKATI